MTIGSFRIGLIHGHQLVVPPGDPEALACVQRRLDCDVLISGHAPTSSIIEYGANAYVCPGSITGAYSAGAGAAGGDAPVSTPSFMLLNVMAGKIEFFVYRLLKGDKMDITRSMFVKGGGKEAKAAGTA